MISLRLIMSIEKGNIRILQTCVTNYEKTGDLGNMWDYTGDRRKTVYTWEGLFNFRRQGCGCSY